MELYQEIIAKALEKESAQIVFPNLKINADEIVEQQCYKALMQIKNIIEDDSLNDSECFSKIENIIYIFEELGSNCRFRHDFG